MLRPGKIPWACLFTSWDWIKEIKHKPITQEQPLDFGGPPLHFSCGLRGESSQRVELVYLVNSLGVVSRNGSFSQGKGCVGADLYAKSRNRHSSTKKHSK